ncbi:MAG: TGS domain-containing protein [Candidatus Altiarchaeales archaeon]|nr:TGS domain-containing protein [Candidatus Altiarchaeales archaeon]
MGLEEKISEVEQEIRKTPYNKATQHHIGKLKAKLAKMREQQISQGSGKGGAGFGVKKTGDATVAFVGYPSVGKSTLLNQLTNAESAVGAYDFTTVDVIPGMMKYENVLIQLLDLPGIITGAGKGKGRGREILSVARNADLIVFVLDAQKMQGLKRLRKELYNVGVRLDQKPPKVKIKRKSQGGINITSTVDEKKLPIDSIKSILNEYRHHNADVTIAEKIDEERFIDALQANRVYIPSLVVINKADLVGKTNNDNPDSVWVSAQKALNLDELKKTIFDKLNFIRIYLKPQGEEADLEEPLVLKKNSCVKTLCQSLHRDFLKYFRYAQVWGKSAKHPGQRVGLNHVLSDGDVVTVVKER